MNRQEQSGFGVIETIIIVAATILLVSAGYIVWRKDQKAPAAAQSTTTTSKRTTQTFVSRAGKFTVQYPASWVQPSNLQACGDMSRQLEIGPNAQSVIKCGGDGTVSQVSITSDGANLTKYGDFGLNESAYTNIQKQPITVDGVKGSSFTGTFVGTANDEGLGNFPKDTKVIKDEFYTQGNTYIISYTQYPNSANEGPTTDQTVAFAQILASLKFN